MEYMIASPRENLSSGFQTRLVLICYSFDFLLNVQGKQLWSCWDCQL